MPPELNARQLTFDSGPVPSFLAKLHKQVNSASSSSSSSRRGHARAHGEDDEGDEFSRFLSTSSRADGTAADGMERETQDSDSETDDLSTAQIVVLKEGKHLSREELIASRQSLVDSERARAEERAEENLKRVQQGANLGVGGSSTSTSSVVGSGRTRGGGDGKEERRARLEVGVRKRKAGAPLSFKEDEEEEEERISASVERYGGKKEKDGAEMGGMGEAKRLIEMAKRRKAGDGTASRAGTDDRDDTKSKNSTTKKDKGKGQKSKRSKGLSMAEQAFAEEEEGG